MLGKRSNILKNSWVLSGDTKRGRNTEVFFFHNIGDNCHWTYFKT